jgi:hypothetical protein
MRGRRGRIFVGCFLAAVSLSIRTVSGRGADTPSARAVQFFQGLPAGDLRVALAPFRPARITTAQLTAALASLPAEGELIPNPEEAAKIGTLAALLAYHSRLDVVVIKVIDLPQAAVGLYARSILLTSRVALTLLTATELQAAVAHELGHEYFWNDFYEALARDDIRALQEVELKSDGIAVLSLAALGLDVGALESGVRKVTRFNELLGATARSRAYPNLDERTRFVQSVVAIGLNQGLVASATDSMADPHRATRPPHGETERRIP